MHVLESLEFLRVMILHKWQASAPPDGRQGAFRGKTTTNSQVARLAYVLELIAMSRSDDPLSRLARLSQGRHNTHYLSTDPSGMTNPYPITNGWYVEGCTNLRQKLDLLRLLRDLGCSRAFIGATQAFVAGEAVDRYLPTLEALAATPDCIQ